MPLYDFKCEQCGKVVEKIVPSSVEQIPCDGCSNDSKYFMKRLVSAGSFILKGNGWYVTDFKNR